MSNICITTGYTSGRNTSNMQHFRLHLTLSHMAPCYKHLIDCDILYGGFGYIVISSVWALFLDTQVSLAPTHISKCVSP